MDTLVEEMDQVAQAAGLFEAPVKPVAVAHSFGAFVTPRYAADRGQRFGGVAIVDMPMTRREDGPRERHAELRDNARLPRHRAGAGPLPLRAAAAAARTCSSPTTWPGCR